jgi:hypothetical protein
MTRALSLIAQAAMIQPRLTVAVIGFALVVVIASAMGASVLEGPQA